MLTMPMYEMTNYICPEPYISGHIYEYDIQRANATMLWKSGAISDDKYNKLLRLPKHVREREVGLMILDNKKIYNIIQDGIKSAKKDIILNCRIEEHEVVRIANDALFIRRKVSNNTSPDGESYLCRDKISRFILKNEYTAMIKLGPLILFFNSYTNDIRVIGIKDNELALHDGFLLTFIIHVINMMERSTLDMTIKYFTDFYNKFLRLELALPFYREFNSNSMFALYSGIGERYLMSSYHGPIRYLDIGYNAFILRELYGILIGKYRTV